MFNLSLDRKLHECDSTIDTSLSSHILRKRQPAMPKVNIIIYEQWLKFGLFSIRNGWHFKTFQISFRGIFTLWYIYIVSMILIHCVELFYPFD